MHVGECEAKLDLYALLGVRPTAACREIRCAHRRLVLLHHPDRSDPRDRSRAEARTKEINLAAAVLLDEAARARYDALRSVASPVTSAPAATGRAEASCARASEPPAPPRRGPASRAPGEGRREDARQSGPTAYVPVPSWWWRPFEPRPVPGFLSLLTILATAIAIGVAMIASTADDAAMSGATRAARGMREPEAAPSASFSAPVAKRPWAPHRRREVHAAPRPAVPHPPLPAPVGEPMATPLPVGGPSWI